MTDKQNQDTRKGTKTKLERTNNANNGKIQRVRVDTRKATLKERKGSNEGTAHATTARQTNTRETRQSANRNTHGRKYAQKHSPKGVTGHKTKSSN